MSERSVAPRRDAIWHCTKSHATLFYWFIALTAFLAVCFLHFWKLGTAPRGFSGDEASIAYNAYCIANTGADEYGVRHPVFFRCFDTYTDPVDVYSAVPPIQLFGLHQWSARLPSALFCLLASVAFFVLLRAWRFGAWFALAGGFAFSLIPWVFPLARNGAFAGHTAALLGLVMGLLVTDSALRQRSNWLAAVAGVIWAFTLYAHQSVRPVLVLLAFGCGLAIWRPLRRRWRVVLVMMIAAFVVLLPMIISIARFPAAVTARFQQVGIFREPASFTDRAVNGAGRYLEYFSPRFLFASGDHERRHHTGHGGELYWSLAPLLLVGLYAAIRHWRYQPRYRVLLVGLLASPVPAALTIAPMHSTRSSYGVVFWLLLGLLGAQALWRHRATGRKLLAVICVAGLVESGMYFADYFGPYQTRCRWAFQTGFADALTYCFSNVRSNQTLYVSGSVGVASDEFIDTDFKRFVYASLLFYGKIDPRTYQRGGFSNTIVRPYLEEIGQPGLLLRCNYTPTYSFNSEGSQISAIPNDESIPDAAKLLATFQDDPFVFQVWEVRTTPQVGVTHNNPRIALEHGGTFRYPDAEAHYNLGTALAQTGRMQEAREHFEQALRINPDDAEAHHNYGVLLQRLGRVPEAIAHYEEALRIKPDFAEAHYGLAIALAQAGKAPEAIELLQQALRIKPDYVEAHYALGTALEQAGRVPEAIQHYEQALRIKPDLTQAQNALARLRVRQ